MAYTSPLFSIDPEFGKRIHPAALKELLDWEKAKFPWLKEKGLTGVDILKHLEDSDKARIREATNKIWESLQACMDVPEGAKLYDVYLGDIWVRSGIISDFKRAIFFPLFDIESLISKGYVQMLKKEVEAAKEKARQEEEAAMEKARQEAEAARKIEEEKRQRVEEAAEEQRRKEETQKRKAAYEALNVPGAAALEYLKPEEHDDFAASILGAVDAYLAKGKYYALDSRSAPYLQFLGKIKNQRAKATAEAEGWRFNKSLHEAIEELKQKLYAQRRDTSNYFGKSKPLASHDLYECLSQEQQQALFDYAKTRVRSEVGKLIPEDYSDFVEWDNKYWFRFSPIADYAYEGVPCLAFSFRLEIVVESKVMLKPVVKKFDGIPFELPREEYRTKDGISYWTVLDKPILLGYLYTHLIPAEVPVVPWQTIPTTLLLGLLQGELVPKGCKVIKASEAEVIYEIKGFAEWVTVPASFHAWLGESRGFEGLAAAGVFSNQTFKIIIEQARGLSVTSIQETTATEQPHDCTEDEFINRLTGLGYPKAHAEILYQKKPEGLGLDEAVRWALREYRKIIPENTGTDVQDDSRTQIH